MGRVGIGRVKGEVGANIIEIYCVCIKFSKNK